jgi:hypothetical protein
MTFPTDPNAPGGPRRSDYLRRAHAERISARDRFATITLARNDPPGAPPIARDPSQACLGLLFRSAPFEARALGRISTLR